MSPYLSIPISRPGWSLHDHSSYDPVNPELGRVHFDGKRPTIALEPNGGMPAIPRLGNYGQKRPVTLRNGAALRNKHEPERHTPSPYLTTASTAVTKMSASKGLPTNLNFPFRSPVRLASGDINTTPPFGNLQRKCRARVIPARTGRVRSVTSRRKG